MNLDSLSFSLSQISYLVKNLTKKNYKSSIQEISHLTSSHKEEAERHLFRCLFSHVDFSGDGKSSGKDFHQSQYLIQECVHLIKKPNFVSTLCYAIDYPLQHQKSLKPSSQLLTQLSSVLKSNLVQEIAFGLALTYSRSSELKLFATRFLQTKIPELIQIFSHKESADKESAIGEIPSTVCQLLLDYILSHKEDLEVNSKQLTSFYCSIVKESSGEQKSSNNLGRFIVTEDTDISCVDISQLDSQNMAKSVNGSLADMICEIGYGFSSSVEDCKNHLMGFGINELSPLSVAQILSMMVRCHTGLDDTVSLQSIGSNAPMWNENKDKQDPNQLTTWNVVVFVQTLDEVLPMLNWKDVIRELDHQGFIIKDRLGLKMLIHALSLGLKHESFPVEHFYEHWRNHEGQLSLYQHILKNSDIFCFADYPCHAVALESLKSPPDDDNRDIITWKSLDLVETLLYLSECAQYVAVRDLFNFPVQHCPDVLVLNVLQINTQLHVLRQELLNTLIPIFLGNHPNSAIILQYAWHTQINSTAVKTIIMRAMADWYMRGDNDQTRLSRILDVAQDLKALSLLLNGSPLPFVIDLACLASRREYLKLDKWLTDKIREHGEQFIQACVSFLKRRCPQIIGGIIKEENLPKSAQLPPETLTTMLACLQACAGNVSQDLSEAILTMVGNCNILLSKPRQPPPGVVKTPRGLEPAFSSASLNPPTAPTAPSTLDPLVSGIGTGISGLTISGSTGGRLGSVGSSSATGNNSPSIGGVFPLTGALNAFSNTPSSPAKMMFTGLSSSGSGSQSAFSSLLPPLSSQLHNQSNTSTSSIGDMASIFPDIGPTVSKEVEEEANRYFACIYNSPNPTMSVDELLEMLKRFKDSPVQLEREVFSCMLRYLFEEYRFFPKYPDKDLQINAQLFGGIIEHGLVTYMALGMALRYILEALRKRHGSNMYYFGITALNRCKNRLKEYPQYCQHLASIQHFNEFPAHLMDYIECGARSQDPPSRPHSTAVGAPTSTIPSGPTSMPPVLSASVSSTVSVPTNVASMKAITAPTQSNAANKTPAAIGAKSIANATNIDTLLVATEKDDKIEVPPESVQDKIAFVVNNLSLANLNQKCEEIKEILTENFWPWIAQYVVMKRASIEPNFHNLYSNFLDTLKMLKLSDMVVKETYRNIRVLLRSDKGIANFSDRSLLKNLGHWLGMLTLTKDKPILQLDLDLKALLIEAYHNGQQELLYVVPFIAKVLDSCAKSRVFKPPNPWTIGIMNVLAELHTEPDLKLNLKFEVEVLCKTLGIDINHLTPGNVLKDPEKLAHIETQLSQSSKNKERALIQRIAVSVPPSSLQGGHLEEQNLSGPVTTSGMISSSNTGFNTPTSMFFSGNVPHAASIVPSSLGAGPIAPSIPLLPRFTYNDLNITSVGGLGQHVQFNSQIALFQQHPQLKQVVISAIERAVQEWIVQVVDRSMKIALTACEQIVKKDFALDPEESRMRAASHHMVRNLTAGMAMITCRDHLSVGISTNLRNGFVAAMKSMTQQQKDMIDHAVNVITQENVELACCFIQKTAVEKAIPEMDKRLSTEFELRKHARIEGRRYCDPSVLTYQAERMPEQIRLNVGGSGSQQMAVYEEFARNIPGFLPTSEPISTVLPSTITNTPTHTTPSSAFLPKPIPVIPTPGGSSFGSSVDEISQIYEKVVNELDNLIRGIMAAPTNPQVLALHSLLEAAHIARNSREIVTAISLLQKAVEGLLEGMTPQLTNDPDLALRFCDGHLLVLKALQDPRTYGTQWTSKNVTRVMMECREDLHYNLDALDVLIRNRLVNMQLYDLHLAQSLENGMNYVAVAFAMQLCKRYLIDNRHTSNVTDSDLYNTVETLFRIASHSRQPPEGLAQLMELIRSNNDPGFMDRAPGGPTSLMHSGISQAREYDDPPGLHEKTEYLLRDWVNMYHSPTAGRDSTKAFSVFVHQMNIQGILKTDDLITRFFRLSTEMCVDLCYRALAEPTGSPTLVRVKCFHTLDAFVRLIALLVKHSGDATNTNTKINLLNKVLGIVTGVLIQDHEVHNTEFQQLPYHRIFIMLFLELNAPEPILETINFQVLTAFCNTLHILRPTRAPGFAYAWLELVSHRVLIGRMLHLTPNQKTLFQAWGMFAQLMIDLFKFLAPFLRNAELPKPIALLYKGTLRVLLVLLHDFPEFLCDYHYGFCDVIPPNCVQMRNLILSAFPRNMRLPDPFTPNLKVDMLSEIAHAPRVITNFSSMIQPPTFKKDLDSYIKTRAPVTFLSELRSNLQVSNEAGQRYNIPLINALVLYVGTQAIAYIQSKGSTPSMSTITHSSHMDIFQNLAVDLDTEGRYLFLNAIANQLRYPNSHTHYFSCTLLYLFAEANTEAIQEQITRVLLERLIVNRPHPWGLLITFIELIKNPSFRFWNHEFVHCAPEIEKLFESVARSCMQQKQAQAAREQQETYNFSGSV